MSAVVVAHASRIRLERKMCGPMRNGQNSRTTLNRARMAHGACKKGAGGREEERERSGDAKRRKRESAGGKLVDVHSGFYCWYPVLLS